MKYSKKKNGHDNARSGTNNSTKSKYKSRKEMRKDKRKAKKQHRNDYYARRSKSGTVNSNTSRENRNNLGANGQRTSQKQNSRQDIVLHRNSFNNADKRTADEFPESHENGSNDSAIEFVKRASLKKSSVYDPLAFRKMEDDREHEKLQGEMRANRNIKLNEENEEEEKLIKKLEKQLKLSKRKNNTVPKAFAADGLDYILDFCDNEKRKQVASSEIDPQGNSDSEFEEDLATAFAQKRKNDLEGESEQQSTLKVGSFSDEPGSSTQEDSSSENRASKLSSMNTTGDSDSDSDFIDSELESESSDSSVYDCGDNGDNDGNHDDEYYGSDEASCADAITNKSVWDSSNSESSNDVQTIERDPVPIIENEESCLLKISKGKRVRFRDEDVSDSENPEKNGSNAAKKMKLKTSEKRKIETLETQPKIKKRKMIAKMKRGKNEPGKYVRTGPSTESDSSDGEESSSDSDDQKTNSIKGRIWEDIYGRLRDPLGNVLTKEQQQEQQKQQQQQQQHQQQQQQSETGVYVPPSLRAHHSRDDEQTQQRLQRLVRQLKGYFNRLTERNIALISSEIENLYSNNSRNDMNSSFITILLESLVTKTMSLERLVMEHAALVSCLHSRVGSDVGAYVLQALVKKFDTLFKDNTEVEDKEIDNVILILCHLYNFHVVSCELIFEILNRLASHLLSKEVELVLIILRTVGFGLRKDNPNKMKSTMVQLQNMAQITSSQCSDTRVKFMLEILLAIKNNNMTRIPGCDPGPVEQMRKVLRSLCAKITISPELNIPIDDLLHADERGRWWVIGSAWAGQGPSAKPSEKENDDTTTTYSAELLELAKRQRMNTDDRRNIFCILMTAQDFQEAYYNLMQLGLKGRQARDIVLVTLHCCLQEKTFNKYYAHVIQSICAHNRVYWVTLQFALWDKVRELKRLTSCQFSNLVQLMQYLLLQGVFTLIMFKIMDLTSLEKPGVKFLRQVLLGILNGDWEQCEMVFSSVAKVPSYKMFCTGLRVFLQQYVNSKITPEDPNQALLKERVEKVDGILSGSML